jgi:anti-repressor protein
MENLKIFKNEQFGEVRVTEVNGEPMFVAKDVAEKLGYTWKGISGTIPHVPEEWRGVCSVQTPFGTQEVICLSEQGLYFFLGRSDKPAALPFQKWIAGEVLPSIRKHGMYATSTTIDSIIADPEFGIKLLTQLKEERLAKESALKEAAIKHEQLQLAEAKIEADAPKVLFTEAVTASSSSVLIGELAKVLTQNGIAMGQNRLFQWLREHHYLCEKGEFYNQPAQRSMEEGLFEMKKNLIKKPDGSTITTMTTKVTGKGQVFFINKFLKKV